MTERSSPALMYCVAKLNQHCVDLILAFLNFMQRESRRELNRKIFKKHPKIWGDICSRTDERYIYFFSLGGKIKYWSGMYASEFRKFGHWGNSRQYFSPLCNCRAYGK